MLFYTLLFGGLVLLAAYLLYFAWLRDAARYEARLYRERRRARAAVIQAELDAERAKRQAGGHIVVGYGRLTPETLLRADLPLRRPISN